MAKKIKEKLPVHDEGCSDCYYNEEGLCKRNPETCPYNQPPTIDEDEEEEDDEL